jgi:hypothetical protein
MSPPPARSCCAQCSHFCNDPAVLEKLLAGLTSLSSGAGSVRDADGICRRHDRYLSADSICPDYTPAIRIDRT